MFIGHVRKSNKGEIKMKNYFNKIIIMFVMALGFMGIGAIQNEIIASAATVGSVIEYKEDGWNRYDNDNDKIKYNGEGWQSIQGFGNRYGKDTFFVGPANNSTIEFEFYGSKLRIYGNQNCGNIITIDGQDYEMPSYRLDNNIRLCYENTSLNLGNHNVKIKAGSYNKMDLDAIDTDGKLIGDEDSSLSLDKSSLTLKESTSEKLIAITTPSSVGVEWSSSNETVATVDQNGKVTGLKEGTCIVTVQIKGTDVKAICEVTVTKEDIVQPEEPSGNGSLCIEMVDGNIKQAQNLNTSDFVKWYQNRDLDKTEKPFYKITNAKGNVEYLIHDKIVAFEIR